MKVPLLPKFVPMLRYSSFVQGIVSKFDFISEPDEGFLHKAAFAFLLVNESGFTWYYNMLPSAKHLLTRAVNLSKEFVEFCTNPQKLQAVVTELGPQVEEIKFDTNEQ